MNLRTAEITQAFTRWLDRYSPPASIKDKPQAMQDEADMLLRALIRSAPGTNVGQWTERVLERVSERMKTRAWPTVFEISDAAKSFNANDGAREDCDRSKLSRDQLFLLNDKILPTARKWLGIPGLKEHGEKTLAHWGEK